MFFAVLVLALLLALPARAECPSSSAELRAEITAGIAAYEAWEWDRFGLARADVASMIGCLGEPLATDDAAQVHLFAALQAGVDKDEIRATEAFRALLAIKPEAGLPEGLAAPGSLLRRAFDAAHVAADTPTRRLPKGDWIVDGQRGASTLPLSRPSVVQYSGSDQLRTWVVAGEPLPDDLSLALSKPRGARSVSADSGPGSSRRRALGMGIASGGALALSAASFALTWSTSNAYWEAGTEEEAGRIRDMNNVFFYSGAATGVLGLGLGVGATISVLAR